MQVRHGEQFLPETRTHVSVNLVIIKLLKAALPEKPSLCFMHLLHNCSKLRATLNPNPVSAAHFSLHALVAQLLIAQSNSVSATQFALHAVIAQTLKSALPQEPTLHSTQ